MSFIATGRIETLHGGNIAVESRVEAWDRTCIESGFCPRNTIPNFAILADTCLARKNEDGHELVLNFATAVDPTSFLPISVLKIIGNLPHRRRTPAPLKYRGIGLLQQLSVQTFGKISGREENQKTRIDTQK